MNRPWLGIDRLAIICFSSVRFSKRLSSDYRGALEGAGHAPLRGPDVAPEQRRSAAAVPLLQCLDDAGVLEDETVRIAPLDIVHAHADEPVHLVDQFAGGGD